MPTSAAEALSPELRATVQDIADTLNDMPPWEVMMVCIDMMMFGMTACGSSATMRFLGRLTRAMHRQSGSDVIPRAPEGSYMGAIARAVIAKEIQHKRN